MINTYDINTSKEAGFPGAYREIISAHINDLLSSNYNTWKVRKEQIILCKLFFEKNPTAYMLGLTQGDNMYMYLHVLCEDTMYFLREGRRRVSIEALMDMANCSYGSDYRKTRYITDTQAAKYKAEFGQFYNLTPDRLMTIWLSKDGGLSDMLHFINILVNRCKYVQDKLYYIL